MADVLTALPEQLSDDKTLFKAQHTLSAGVVDGIRYIIYIDSRKYAEMSSPSRKKSLGRVVGKLNERLRGSGEHVMAIGPGRWGSSNINLGVNVSYADIDNIKVLVEMGRSEAGHEPELSYGTHFFQDLVEADIIYLPIFPDRPEAVFNNGFFTASPNMLLELLPEMGDFKDYIRVIDVPAASGGAYAHVAADAQARRAICYLG